MPEAIQIWIPCDGFRFILSCPCLADRREKG